MLFVDGSNFLRALADEASVPIRTDNPNEMVLRLAANAVSTALLQQRKTHLRIIRKYWFGGYRGNPETDGDRLRAILRECEYDSFLVKQKKNGREKGVDTEMTRVLLVNCFARTFDVGIVVAGDEDFLPVIREAKRYGCQIWGGFLEGSDRVAKPLLLEFDHFLPLLQGSDRESTLERIRNVQSSGS